MAKGFFIDLSKCTACRGCQVACKQWKKLPADATHNWGSHQNPADLSGTTLKLVRMEEIENNGELAWVFFPEQCRHCVEPPCRDMSEVEGSIYTDETTGAVIFTEKTAEEDFEMIHDVCPYNIPRQAEDGTLTKCDMCNDRVQNGMLPACVLTCPTGTMNFGDLEDMKTLAEKRLAEVQKTKPGAVLGDLPDVSVIYLFEYDPALYFESAVAELGPKLYSRHQMFAKLMRRDKRA